LLGATVGKQVRTFGRFTAMNAKYLQIGDRVVIGSDVRISTNVPIHTSKLNIEQSRSEHVQEPIRIGNNVWNASSCVISTGVTIGDNSIIAAGAVVIDDVPGNSIAAGISAKEISKLRM